MAAEIRTGPDQGSPEPTCARMLDARRVMRNDPGVRPSATISSVSDGPRASKMPRTAVRNAAMSALIGRGSKDV